MPNHRTGNLTDDPFVTKFSSDKVNTRLRLASSRRTRHTNSSSEFEWRDGDTVYINIELWGQLAINASKSLKKGMQLSPWALCALIPGPIMKPKATRTHLHARPAVGIDMNRYIWLQRMDALHLRGMVLARFRRCTLMGLHRG